jgi:hypothetical protein
MQNKLMETACVGSLCLSRKSQLPIKISTSAAPLRTR